MCRDEAASPTDKNCEILPVELAIVDTRVMKTIFVVLLVALGAHAETPAEKIDSLWSGRAKMAKENLGILAAKKDRGIAEACSHILESAYSLILNDSLRNKLAVPGKEKSTYSILLSPALDVADEKGRTQVQFIYDDKGSVDGINLQSLRKGWTVSLNSGDPKKLSLASDIPSCVFVFDIETPLRTQAVARGFRE